MTNTWAWDYIDEPGKTVISGGYANTWFSADILLAYQAGIVSGKDASGRCDVGASMTRAEVCQMLYNAGIGKTKFQIKENNGIDGAARFIRDGKVYVFNPVKNTAYDVFIHCYGPYDASTNSVPYSDDSYYVYRPRDGIDIRQQEWPTHPEFWGN